MCYFFKLKVEMKDQFHPSPKVNSVVAGAQRFLENQTQKMIWVSTMGR